MTSMNEYPCKANCWVNSGCINKEINSIKSSIVLSRLCPSLAVCPMPEATRKPPKQISAVPKNSTQTRLRTCPASVYDSLPKERKSWKGGVCSFLLGGWQEQGKKKSEWDVGVKNLMSSHGLPYPRCCCRQAGTSPEQHHMLPVCSCNFCNQR